MVPWAGLQSGEGITDSEGHLWVQHNQEITRGYNKAMAVERESKTKTMKGQQGGGNPERRQEKGTDVICPQSFRDLEDGEVTNWDEILLVGFPGRPWAMGFFISVVMLNDLLEFASYIT